MDSILIEVCGNWGHFKKPETNNNPLTHDFITKTALIGMIGAVLGINRPEMKSLFPQLSEDLLYGVQLINPVQKQSWQFTLRRASNQMKKAPGAMEFLKDPAWQILITRTSDRSKTIFEQFSQALETDESCYTPVLGLHNCPANLQLLKKEVLQKKEGYFTTQGFITSNQELQIDGTETFRIGFEKMPTYQNDDFWNLPDRYVQINYPAEGHSLSATGEYYQTTNGEAWVLI